LRSHRAVSFPHALGGNPVTCQPGCPTKAFGHDGWAVTSWSNYSAGLRQLAVAQTKHNSEFRI